MYELVWEKVEIVCNKVCNVCVTCVVCNKVCNMCGDVCNKVCNMCGDVCNKVCSMICGR